MRHLDRRTRVAVAAALLAPAVLLGGVATASAAPASPTAASDNPDSQWWDSGSGFDKRAAGEDDGSGAQNGEESDESSRYEEGEDSDGAPAQERRMPGSDESDVAAQRYANEVGFAPEKSSDRNSRRTGPATDDPRAQTEPSQERPAQEPAERDDSGARDGEPALDQRPSEDSAQDEKSDQKAAGADEFSVETPQKNFDEGAERVRRGRNSDIPKPATTDKTPAVEKKAAPKKSAAKKSDESGADSRNKVRAKAKGKKG